MSRDDQRDPNAEPRTNPAPRILNVDAVPAGAAPVPARFWRTLEEHAGDSRFDAFVRQEFPSQVEAIVDPVQRRTFLKLMGASMALAGFSACTRQPAEPIVPYVRQPEELIPGRPLFYATAMSLGGVASGLLVECHEGRPTKVEGNALHPGSLGAADVFGQAAILGLYDPDRARTLTRLGEIQAWPSFLGAMRAALTAQTPLQGAGIRILTESIASPTLGAQIHEILARFPSARWHQWDPASGDQARAGTKLAFGEYLGVQYHFDRADVVLTLDADVLSCGPGSLRYARDFAARRRPGDRPMNRLYAVEVMPTPTGARADHRLALRPGQIEPAVRRLAAAVGAPGAASVDSGRSAAFVDAVAADLRAHRGACLVVAGAEQSPAVHALAHAINGALGNIGRTITYTDPVEVEPTDQLASIRALVDDMNAGRVDLLVVVSGNPVYTAPPDLKFGDAMGRVPVRVHLSLHEDETSALCHWQIPESHFLESWSDARAFDGTVSIVQPVIAPLYETRSAHELLAALSERPERSAYDIVRGFWSRETITPEFEARWRRWVHDGAVPDTAFAPKAVGGAAVPPPGADGPAAAGGFEIAFRADPSVLDGRFANNGWLQELPKPITRLTWDNAVLVSPATAARLEAGGMPATTGGEHGQIISDVVEVRCQGRSVQGALFVVPGHADDCATVHLGFGRTRGGRVAPGVGFDANALRAASALSFAAGAEIVKTGRTHPLACTQYHFLMEGRHTVRAVTLEEFERDPAAMTEGDETPPKTLTLYPEFPYDGYKWGMAIDVNACIGCNACVVACQAENNIPVVGKEQVLRGREMHWIRIDTYHRGPAERPETFFQPVPCMQCENAPCEVVCPVGATVHSHEGLNDMVYNRCVGTRYCSNNCPYKVRRFNFLLYQDWDTPSLKLGRNPDVTVRSRGVMEKCTYCVQRINEAKIDAEKEGRTVRDGEIQPACAQTCPAEAIVFGNLNDPGSRVSALKASERNYALLGELNTRPRTTYLGAVRNVNAEIGE
ncbi:MAG: TAT-variant-translocated molybdopterin oxidoreductase [Acidobacteria bacterium]|nr:TAT-variant-translocated molybdopterin oxidoreductase [Acidobacteriota bacterium]